MARVLIALALLLVSAKSDNSTVADVDASDSCDAIGPWSLALEDWATSPQSDRHGRIMALPPTKGYYVTERIDTPYLAPPPPPIAHPQSHGYASPNQGYIPNDSYLPQNQNYMPPKPTHIPLNQGQLPTNQLLHKKGVAPPKKSQSSHNSGPTLMTPQDYKEWEASKPPGAGKIVNRPPNKVKPNYPVDRVDEPPRKQVSETDLYLLGAIEKLVYRADLAEKRLRAVEDSLHELLAGPDDKPEACAGGFERVGAACYLWGAAEDWKQAALACRKQRAALAELAERGKRRAVLSKLVADKTLKGSDFWTGGLNPGLLWIWSHSARPVSLDDGNGNNNSSNSTSGANIPGEGRCLALTWDPARRAYALRGRDCGTALRYICQKDDEREELSNEIQRAARRIREERRSKLLWHAP